MIKQFLYVLLVSVLLISCKSRSITTASTIAMSSKKVIKNHYDNCFNKKTVNARLKATYKDRNNLQTITIKLRLEKDSIIWMSGTMLGFPFAKIMITPTKVQFYEKVSKTYFEGDFELLSDFLGTEVNFDVIQNLLLGQAVQDLKKDKYLTVIESENYLVVPKKQEELFDILFWVNPTNFKISRQEIRQPIEQKRLTISYSEYQNNKGEELPKKISIVAVENVNRTIVDLEYRSIEFNKKLSFPFNIPTGYQEIILNE